MRSFSLALLLLTLCPLASIADDLSDAQALLKRGEPTRALQKLETHIAAKPQDAQARFLQGVVLTELTRTEEAKAVFRQLTVEFPEFPEPYNNLAVLYAASGNFDVARQALESAVRANPKYGTAHENLGDIYAQLARSAYDKAAELESTAALQRKLRLARELAEGAPAGKAPISTGNSK